MKCGPKLDEGVGQFDSGHKLTYFLPFSKAAASTRVSAIGADVPEDARNEGREKIGRKNKRLLLVHAPYSTRKSPFRFNHGNVTHRQIET